MALPNGLATVTVTAGPYLTASGSPAVGQVRLVPESRVVHVPTGSVILPRGVTATLDATGSATLTVVASDAAGVTPSPFAYRVWWDLDDGAPEPTRVVLPAANPTADLDAQVAATTGTGPVSVPAVTSLAGLSGALTAQPTIRTGNTSSTLLPFPIPAAASLPAAGATLVGVAFSGYASGPLPATAPSTFTAGAAPRLIFRVA